MIWKELGFLQEEALNQIQGLKARRKLLIGTIIIKQDMIEIMIIEDRNMSNVRLSTVGLHRQTTKGVLLSSEHASPGTEVSRKTGFRMPIISRLMALVSHLRMVKVFSKRYRGREISRILNSLRRRQWSSSGNGASVNCSQLSSNASSPFTRATTSWHGTWRDRAKL